LVTLAQRQAGEIAVVLDDDVVGLAELGEVDNDVPGDDEAVSTLAPALVEPLDPVVRSVALVAEGLAQRGLHDPVGKGLPVGQVERVVQAGHAGAPWAAGGFGVRLSQRGFGDLADGVAWQGLG